MPNQALHRTAILLRSIAYRDLKHSHPAVRNRKIYSPNPRASAAISSLSALKQILIGAQHTSQS